MRQRLLSSELLDVLEGDVVKLVADEGLAAAEKLGIFTYSYRMKTINRIRGKQRKNGL